jgi:cobalamin biosynthesis protein CobC
MHEISELRARVLAAESHGGNLAEARRLFPQAPEPWLDLSAAASPFAYPFGDLAPKVLARLPEAAHIRRLEIAATEFYGAANAAWVAAPGTQALIQWLPQILRARQVGVLGFTYSEHTRAWRDAGANVRICEKLDELADMDVGVVVNPNNPDGRLVPAADLANLAARLSKRGGFLVVDEAFIDFLPREASLVSARPSEGAILLRSFGKTFGLPGLRLGFAVAAPEFCAKLRAALGPWPVSGAAIAIGCKAFADRAWFAAIRVCLAADIAKLDAILATAGFASVGGTPLFRLVSHPEAAAMFERLGRAGIWVRRFAERPEWLRFSIPTNSTDLSRLVEALRFHDSTSFDIPNEIG